MGAAVLGYDVSFVHAGIDESSVLCAGHVEVITEENGVKADDGEEVCHGG